MFGVNTLAQEKSLVTEVTFFFTKTGWMSD